MFPSTSLRCCDIYDVYDVCVHRQQSGEGEKNGSEDDDEEKPGRRVMGPRKKFVWDDKLRSVSPREQRLISYASGNKCTSCTYIQDYTESNFRLKA